ncbi:hypothetical protein, variant [Cladophialophora immunda]|uniref:Inositolphosphotransferase Aur1/Ipt1 domain-containing protein n=1 Tax=Cladophialophora immunda TaxID=569365 RepID=A0A0D2B9H0_9EURO|nr:uncharacterized protein PV07_01044 [Cladophialophora immunda]XP_016254469.1 hypothetical protein, variant [Cladophialophora immunda]KIW34252.1 hypothetical protein PV07_01044 [Cladophialophora immunda]KIW34253.1 hypothetical protein, variant [Cladophialophora immunda]OQU99080.1 hypothetical protein CLAIMM_04769 isoform 1 [Cladophialophora immunda]OQU99081.1 hypothetical protein CLAIMM_04769 isoform 2 [Cladophialophora immunda]OQU99082.1 hypothetical protein CLAIMM_04769 isoform 3 [Cladophi
MGFLGLGEPSWGTLIIFLGAWINRDFTTPIIRPIQQPYVALVEDVGHEMGLEAQGPMGSGDISIASFPNVDRQRHWRERELSLFGLKTTIQTPNTAVFRDRMFSKVLLRFPFLVEIVYWALIYGVYQFARGQLAIRLVDQTVNTACHHALAVIKLEKRLHIFWELTIQQFFLQFPRLMWWINRIYSFVHLPATITFLVGLYYFAITRNRSNVSGHSADQARSSIDTELYESRRRALALCNLFAFCVFSSWPCMPPRLLGDSKLPGEPGELARSFGFIDTIHSRDGAASVFNTRKWTNQLAAMPSLHFGYSLLIGVSIMRLPLAPPTRRYRMSIPAVPFLKSNHTGLVVRIPSLPKLLCEFVGFLYPFSILIAIIATANHFILDAVAGGMICFFALRCNHFMKNFLPLEDYVFWCLRTHKPVQEPAEQSARPDDKS